MSTRVNPPPRLKIPKQFTDNTETRSFFEQINTILFQQWTRSGGSVDRISESSDQIDANNQDITVLNDEVNNINNQLDLISLNNRVIVKDVSAFSGELDSNTEYFLDGVIDMQGQTITIPDGGLTISGYNANLSQLISAEDNYTLFSGGGNVTFNNIGLSLSGLSSVVFSLTATDPTNKIRLTGCEFINCTGLGEITGYGRYIEQGVNRTGGTPVLTLSGTINEVEISGSVKDINDVTALFKEGTLLQIDGRFFADINCDLPAIGALLDLQETNFTNSESFIIQSSFIARNGAIDPTDSGVSPNINEDNVKSRWLNNVGLSNTKKYLKTTCTTEIETVITASATYYPILGTITVGDSVHFDMVANGEFRLLTSGGLYSLDANIVITGTANTVLSVRVVKSEDDGATYPIEINKLTRQINSVVGGRDVALFPINFITKLNKNDRLRLEVENQTDTSNVTMTLDSYFNVSEV